MAKSGRKRKKEDKAKTQFKKPKTAPGKHLPKGTNVTKTEFKVSKIVIQDQLKKSDQSGPVTKKKLGLRDVLTKLNHFSQAVRADGLDGLKELVTSPDGPALVLHHLSEILVQIAPLTSDREPKIRSATGPILEAVLGHVTARSLEPLHGLLSAHLCRGLSHLDTSIQFECLSLLDSLVTVAPEFVASVHDQLLPNCLAQISGNGARSGLSSAVSEKMTTLKWRTAVLERLNKILVVVSQQEAAKDETEDRVLSASHSADSYLRCGLYSGRPSTSSRVGLADLTVRQKSEPPLVNHIARVLPLLVETWREATATGSARQKKGSLLSPDTLQLLQCQLGVVQQLLQLSQLWEARHGGGRRKILDLVEQNYLKDLTDTMVVFLPYSVAGQGRGNTAPRECSRENLVLAHVYLQLATRPAQEIVLIIQSLVDKCLDDGLQQNQLVCVVRLLLRGAQASQWGEAIVKRLDEQYRGLGKMASYKTAVMDLLIELTLSGRYSHILEEWIETLVTDLVKLEVGHEVINNVLETCLKLAKRGNEIVLRSFLENYEKILGLADSCKESELRSRIETNVLFIHHYCLNKVSSPVGSGDDEQ